MPKAIRPYAPRSIFHLTARVQNRTRWFDEPDVRDAVATAMCESSIVTRTPLVAFTVMGNHMHLVVRQAQAPLGWMMHRVLHHTAILVKKRFQPDGHVFGKRYWSGMCEDAEHARQVIIYNHLNAYYAGLCEGAEDYRWNSHGVFVGDSNCKWREYIAADIGLALFTDDKNDTEAQRASYNKHIAYWIRHRKLSANAKYIYNDDEWELAPHAQNGDVFWSTQCATPATTFSASNPRLSISDCAAELLRRIDAHVTVEDVQFAGRCHALTRIRWELIAGLLTRGYRGAAIARYLNVSQGLVSTIRSQLESAVLARKQHVILRRG